MEEQSQKLPWLQLFKVPNSPGGTPYKKNGVLVGNFYKNPLES